MADVPLSSGPIRRLKAGAVETGRRRIVVKDAEALGRIANEVA